MARRFIGGNQTRILIRGDEPGGGTLVNYGWVKPTLNVTGTLAATSVTGMHFDYARTFNGANRIQVADSTHFNHVNIACWFKISSAPSGTEQLIMRANTYNLQLNGSTLEAKFRDSAHNFYTASYDITSLVGTWIYAHATYDGDYSYLYVNGIENKSTIAVGNNLDTNSTSVYVGATHVSTQFFNGDMAEILIAPDCVFMDEVYWNYNADVDISLGFSVETDSIAVYNFDNDSGGTVVDDVGSHNGSIVGTVTQTTDSPFGKKGAPRGYSFPGAVGNYISIPHHTDFNLGPGKSLTVEVLMMLRDKTGAVGHTAVAKIGTVTGYRNGWYATCYIHGITGRGAEAIILGNTASDIIIQSVGTLEYIIDDRPFYYAASYDGVNKRLIVCCNGNYGQRSNPDFPEDVDWSQLVNTNVTTIGQVTSIASANPIDGEIYAVRFTNRAKTMKEFDTFLTGSNLSR